MNLQNACFSTAERFMNKALIFINSCFLKKKAQLFSSRQKLSTCAHAGNDEHKSLRRPLRASLRALYAALLILTREQAFSSIDGLPLSFSILADLNISR